MGLAWDIMFWSVCINVAIGFCGFMIEHGGLFDSKPGYKNLTDTEFSYTLLGTVESQNATTNPVLNAAKTVEFWWTAILTFFSFIGSIIWVYPTLVNLFGIPMWIAGGLEALLAIIVLWNIISWFSGKDYRY